MKKKITALSALLLSFSCLGQKVSLRDPYLKASGDPLEEYLKNEEKIIEKTALLLEAKVKNEAQGKPGTKEKQHFRAAHPAGHALLEASFVIEDTEFTAQLSEKNALFVPGKHEAFVRFSNGRFFDDRDSDLRGMAVKIFDVDQEKYFDPTSRAVDLLAINTPLPVGTSEEFMKLIEGIGSFVRWGVCGHRSRLLNSMKLMYQINSEGKNIASLLGETYEPRMYYAVNEKTIIRFMFKPTTDRNWIRPKTLNKNFLKEDLKKRLRPGMKEYRFDFMVSIHDSSEVTTEQIEDTTSPLPSNYVRTGYLEIPAQELTEEMDRVGENMSFNPWRSTLRPLGSIGRAREFIYNDILSFRRKENKVVIGGKEPDSPEAIISSLH